MTTTTLPTGVGRPTVATDAPSQNRSFANLAGWCGLAGSIAYLTTVLATSLLGSAESYTGPDDIVRYLDDVGEASYRGFVYGIAGIVMSILFMPFGVAMYRRLHSRALAGLGSLAMVVGLALLIPAYVISILEVTALTSAGNELGARGSEALYMVEEAAAAVQVVFFTAGSILTLCVAPLLWAIEGRRTGVLSTRLSQTGFLVALSGLVWFIWFVESPAILVVLLINVIASLVYFVVLSRQLISAR